MREGIKKKMNAHNRKERKKAKKDITWRSKHKKDPGIPSSFPYKDKIINQIEETKRKNQEEKIRLRAERKAAKAAAGGDDQMEEDDEDDEDDEEEEGNGLAALLESAQKAVKAYDGEESDDNDAMEEYEINEYEIEEDEEDEDDKVLDKSRKAYDKIFKAVVDAADVILYVMDARDPEGTRSKKVEEAVLQSQGKRLLLVLNKVDLVPEDNLKKWLDFLQSSFPTIPLKSSNSAVNSVTFNKKLTQTNTANSLLQALKTYSQKSNLKRSIIVGVIGYPNVGKSSVINSLLSRHGGTSTACPVGNQAGVTTSLREIKVDNKLKILDSPGIVFPDSKKKTKTQQVAELALLNAIPPKMISDPIPAITLLIKRLSKSDEMANSFKKLYNIPALPAGNADEFTKNVLIHIARTRGRLGKGGIPNLHAAGSLILNDWRDGKILGYSLPKSSKKASEEEDKPKVPIGATNAIPPPKVEQTTVVQEWSKEFDLDSLFGDVFGSN